MMCHCEPECRTELKEGDRILNIRVFGKGDGTRPCLLAHASRAIEFEHYRESIPARERPPVGGTSPRGGGQS